MRKLILIAAIVSLAGCGTILPAGYGLFAPQGSDEQQQASAEFAAIMGAVSAGASAFRQPVQPALQPRLPVYTSCSNNRYTGVNCISQ